MISMMRRMMMTLINIAMTIITLAMIVIMLVVAATASGKPVERKRC